MSGEMMVKEQKLDVPTKEQSDRDLVGIICGIIIVIFTFTFFVSKYYGWFGFT